MVECRFQVRYISIPGMDKPVQPLEVVYAGIYGQDVGQMIQGCFV